MCQGGSKYPTIPANSKPLGLRTFPSLLTHKTGKREKVAVSVNVQISFIILVTADLVLSSKIRTKRKINTSKKDKSSVLESLWSWCQTVG